jgi:hypothetical protein
VIVVLGFVTLARVMIFCVGFDMHMYIAFLSVGGITTSEGLLRTEVEERSPGRLRYVPMYM